MGIGGNIPEYEMVSVKVCEGLASHAARHLWN